MKYYSTLDLELGLPNVNTVEYVSPYRRDPASAGMGCAYVFGITALILIAVLIFI